MRALAGILGALVLVFGAVPAQAQDAAPLDWRSPVAVNGGEPLTSVACPSASYCVAVDGRGHVLTTGDPGGGAGAWRRGTIGYAPTDISCSSVLLCVAVDVHGHALISKQITAEARSWESVRIADEPCRYTGENCYERQNRRDLTGIDCPSASLCVVVTAAGDVITATDPAAGDDSTWTTAGVDRETCQSDACSPWWEAGFTAVSCPSESLCIAVDDHGQAFTSTNPTGGTAAWKGMRIDDQVSYCGVGLNCQARLLDVDCPSVSLCAAGDDAGNVVVSRNPNGTASEWIIRDLALITYELSAVSCASESLCVASDGWRSYMATDPVAGAWTVRTVPGTVRFSEPLVTDLACPSESLCVAVDSRGNVITAEPGQVEQPPPPPTRAQIKASLLGQITPRGKAARIGTLLRRKGYALSFSSPAAGAVDITWILRPGNRRKAVTVARGHARFAAAGTRRIKLRLTRRGVALLRRTKRIALSGKASLRSPASGSTSATKTFSLRR